MGVEEGRIYELGDSCADELLHVLVFDRGLYHFQGAMRHGVPG